MEGCAGKAHRQVGSLRGAGKEVVASYLKHCPPQLLMLRWLAPYSCSALHLWWKTFGTVHEQSCTDHRIRRKWSMHHDSLMQAGRGRQCIYKVQCGDLRPQLNQADSPPTNHAEVVVSDQQQWMSLRRSESDLSLLMFEDHGQTAPVIIIHQQKHSQQLGHWVFPLKDPGLLRDPNSGRGGPSSACEAEGTSYNSSPGWPDGKDGPRSASADHRRLPSSSAAMSIQFHAPCVSGHVVKSMTWWLQELWQ